MKKSLAELMGDGRLRGTARILDPTTAVDDPRFRAARQVQAIWEDLGDGRMPDRQQIDPVAIGPALLPLLVLIDVLEGGRDYRWRLFGSRHQEEYGANLTGSTLSELERGNPTATAFRRILDHTVSSRAPCHFELIYLNQSSVDRHALGVMLPLTNRSDDVAVLWGVTDWWCP